MTGSSRVAKTDSRASALDEEDDLARVALGSRISRTRIPQASRLDLGLGSMEDVRTRLRDKRFRR